MSYKNIERSREIRLWIGQIMVPVTLLTCYIIKNNPQAVNSAKNKFNNVKDNIKNKFKK